MNAIEFTDDAQRFYALQDYTSALTVIANAEADGKATYELLLIKAACIQLSGNTDYPLRWAFEIYEFILQRKPEDSRALTEAGFFLLNVEDNSDAAQSYFAQAVDAHAEAFAESIVGFGCAKGESGSSTESVMMDIDEMLERLRTKVLQRLTR